jgi:hypothetical protein
MAIEPIADDDELYRRLAPLQIKPDGSIASVAFKFMGEPPAVSVDLAHRTDPDRCLAAYRARGFGLGVLTAQGPRSLGLDVIHDPLPENDAHSEIRELRGTSTKELQQRLAQMTAVRIVPTKPRPPD